MREVEGQTCRREAKAYDACNTKNIRTCAYISTHTHTYKYTYTNMQVYVESCDRGKDLDNEAVDVEVLDLKSSPPVLNPWSRSQYSHTPESFRLLELPNTEDLQLCELSTVTFWCHDHL